MNFSNLSFSSGVGIFLRISEAWVSIAMAFSEWLNLVIFFTCLISSSSKA